MKLRFHAFACLAVLCAALSSPSSVRAAVPAEYTGTPYLGTPQQIPGKVELADLDEGGVNVAFWADHRRENAVAEGYSPISGDDYREGNLNLPNICKTNRALEVPGEGSEDFWEDGTIYPSPADPYWYYMGFAHTVDWVRVTVNVLQAGTYNVSSNWACDNDPCGLSIWFNDGDSPADNPDRPLDGENKTGTVEFPATGDYHIWRAYPNFAQVELSAGEQLMTFHVEVADHLQYGFLQFDLVGGGGTGGSGGTGGAANGGTGGTGPTGGAPAAGGTTSVNPGTSGAPAGGSGPGAVSNANTESSCALGPAPASRAPSLAGLVLAASLLLLRRRKS